MARRDLDSPSTPPLSTCSTGASTGFFPSLRPGYLGWTWAALGDTRLCPRFGLPCLLGVGLGPPRLSCRAQQGGRFLPLARPASLVSLSRPGSPRLPRFTCSAPSPRVGFHRLTSACLCSAPSPPRFAFTHPGSPRPTSARLGPPRLASARSLFGLRLSRPG